MAAPRMSVADREREVREAAARKRGLSARLGGLGVVLLFLGGVATLLSPENVVAFLVVMVVGILLVGAALMMVMGSVSELTKDR
ncbi:MAG: hypothetical protein A3K68_03750 [Euryarchaeota archaeon RBG_16_68_13]|nr:MAG: hypothetical protein A3K68_03750 [Euryarchaeota archaeon RBG_16_68_13]